MSNDTDPVDSVILAFLDYLEGSAEPPSLDHLTAHDRDRAQRLIESLEAGRGIDPYASRPSVEALLADTELASMLIPTTRSYTAVIDLSTIEDVLSAVDERAQVEVDSDAAAGPTVVFSYLDLRARFVLIDVDSPVVTDDVRTVVQRLFDVDPDTARVGVVARTDDLLTQIVSADDFGATITTPLGQPDGSWQSPLPLALAARRMLEQSAPEWDSFDFDQTASDPLDVAAIATNIAQRVIDREAARPYQGEKARAYRGLAGQESVFAELIADVAARGVDAVDLDAETTRIAQEAA